MNCLIEKYEGVSMALFLLIDEWNKKIFIKIV